MGNRVVQSRDQFEEGNEPRLILGARIGAQLFESVLRVIETEELRKSRVIVAKLEGVIMCS